MPSLFLRLWHDVADDQSPLATPRTGADGAKGCKIAVNHEPAATIVDGLQADHGTACRETLKR
jgi:hypothetical protein